MEMIPPVSSAFPASSPNTADAPRGAAGRAADKGLSEQPPKSWVDAMLKKHGPMRISENARTVLERRYLKKGLEGEALETPEEMVAPGGLQHRAGGGYLLRRPARGRAPLGRGVLRADGAAGVPAQLPDADERGPRAAAALRLLRPARRGLDGVHLRGGQEHRADPQERRRHRLLLLAAAAARTTSCAPRRGSPAARSPS